MEHPYLKKGDLVRMTISTAAAMQAYGEATAEWQYGIYLDTVQEVHTYDGFCDVAETYDRVLHNGIVMYADDYWYLERVS